MKLRLVPSRQGVQWVRQGFAAFFKRPMAFASLFGLFWLGMMIVSLVPVLGALAAFGSMPVMSLGFMIATQQALSGGTPTLSVFWAPLQASEEARKRLLQLCLAYAVCVVVMLTAWLWIDGDRLQVLREAMTANAAGDGSAPVTIDSRVLVSLFAPLVVLSLLSVPFWHAPALVHWSGVPVGKALFFSTVACWRNRGAMLVYALCWAGVMLGFTFVSTLLFALIGLPQLAPAAAVPAVLLLTAAFYASLLFTFVDSFELATSIPSGDLQP